MIYSMPLRTDAATLTVNGSSTCNYAPFNALYTDTEGTKSQSIYLTTDLAAMAGSKISGIRYYADAKLSWSRGDGTIPTFQVALAEVDANSLTDFLSPSFTVVYTGKPAKGTKELFFDFSGSPYYYSGVKNLLVQVSVSVTGGWQSASFYAVERSGASYYYYNKNSDIYDYLPKTTFTYEELSASCPKPTNITNTELSPTTATFTWNKGGDETEWQYICLPAITSLSWSNPSVQTTTSRTATVTGLLPNVPYYFCVRAYCDDEHQSGGSMYRFTTPRMTDDLPFFEDFNCLTSGIPDLWDNSEGTTTTDSHKWNYYAEDANKLHDGPCVRFDSWINKKGKTNMLRTKQVKIHTATTLSFYYKNPTGGDFSVYYSIDGVETALATGLTGQSSWRKVSYTIPAQAEEKAVEIVFKGTSNYGSDDAYIYLDDVSLSSASCAAQPTGVTANAIGGSSAQLSWTSSASKWSIRYRSDCGQWIVVDNITFTPYTLTGLDPKTEYEVQVTAVCDEDEVSAWSAPEVFETKCGAMTRLPWSHDFERDETGSGVVPPCWGSITYTKSGMFSSTVYPCVTGSGAYNSSNCLHFYAGITGESEQYVILPEIEEQLSELILEFYYKNGNSGANYPQFTVGYLTDAEDASTFVAKQAITRKTSYTKASVDLSSFPAGVHTIAIKYGDAKGGWLETEQDGYIDDIRIRHAAQVFTDAFGDGYWTTAANWEGGVLPSSANRVLIRKPVVVPAGETVEAKSVVIDFVDGHNGQIEIQPTGMLVIADTLRRVTGTSRAKAYAPTAERDLVIGSSRYGNGGLAIGSHNTEDGLNNATVNFYTKSHGESGSSASIAQYVGTPFSNRPQMLYQFYNSWMYKTEYKGGDYLSWTRLDGSDPLEAFQGYCVFSADPLGHVYWMQGTLVASEDQTINLAYHGGASTAEINEHMLANSWAAPIKINAFDEDDFINVDATIYVFNSGSPDDYAENNGGSTNGDLPGQYSVFTPGTADDADNIPSMQSFSVYANNDEPGKTPTITLNYDRLVYTPAAAGLAVTPNRSPRRWNDVSMGEPDRMRLYVTGASGYADRVYMLEREDYSEDYENGFDGRKIFGEPVAPQLYAITANGNMAINCLPTWEGAMIGFRKGTQDDTYTFTFDYSGNNQWYLNDLKAQTSTLITPDNSYLFYAGDGDQAARFVLSRTPLHGTPTAIDNDTDSQNDSSADVRKLLINGTMYIIRNGRMYYANGAAVR